MFVSVGKYPTVMYYKGRSHQASLLGGVLTLIGIVALLVYSVIIISQIYSDNKQYNINLSAKKFENLRITK